MANILWVVGWPRKIAKFKITKWELKSTTHFRKTLINSYIQGAKQLRESIQFDTSCTIDNTTKTSREIIPWLLCSTIVLTLVRRFHSAESFTPLVEIILAGIQRQHPSGINTSWHKFWHIYSWKYFLQHHHKYHFKLIPTAETHYKTTLTSSEAVFTQYKDQ